MKLRVLLALFTFPLAGALPSSGITLDLVEATPNRLMFDLRWSQTAPPVESVLILHGFQVAGTGFGIQVVDNPNNLAVDIDGNSLEEHQTLVSYWGQTPGAEQLTGGWWSWGGGSREFPDMLLTIPGDVTQALSLPNGDLFGMRLVYGAPWFPSSGVPDAGNTTLLLVASLGALALFRYRCGVVDT